MTASREGWTDEQLLLTTEEAARMLNVGRTTLYALIKDGQLRSVHIGRSCRLTRAELLRYVTRLDALANTPALKEVRARSSVNYLQIGLFDLEPASLDAT